MSLEKAIKHGKEKRKPYYKKAERAFRSCRNHGSCPYCSEGRQYNTRKRILIAEDTYEEGF